MKYAIYIKYYAKSLIQQLSEQWSDNVALELHKTLGHYIEAASTPADESEKEQPKKKERKPEDIQLRDNKTNEMYKQIFDIAVDAASKGSNVIRIKLDTFNVSLPKMMAVLQNINGCNYKKKFHPDCKVSYRKYGDTFELTFKRKEADA